MNKCIKVTLNKCLNYNMKEVKKIIKEFQRTSCLASNKAITMWYMHTIEVKDMKSKDKSFNDDSYCKETYGKTYRNVIEGEMKKLMPLAHTDSVGTLHQQLVQANWKKEKDDVLSHKSSLPTYKKDTPYYFKNKNYKLRNHNGYFADLSFFSKAGLKEYGFKSGHKFEFQIDKLDGNKKATINKIIAGEYKQGSAQISISKKGKIELIISYGFEVKKEQLPLLDHNKILGVDLGITNVATMIAYDSTLGKYDYFSWKENVVDGSELIKFRQKYYNLRREMSVGSKIVGEGRMGHGYKTRMKPVNKIRNKVANFADTYNHKVSKYIVDYAIKHNCGVIQMENLSGFSEQQTETLLKSWSYYDLQQKVKYKAEEKGIEVIFIEPKYTSKRCNHCGCIHVDNRNCKENQAKFECKVCGHKDNADINAAKNIAMPNIDKIIENTKILGLEKQDK